MGERATYTRGFIRKFRDIYNTVMSLDKRDTVDSKALITDALHCQTETAATIIENGGDYLLNAKGNQEILENDIKDFAQDEILRTEMEQEQTREKNGFPQCGQFALLSADFA